MVVNTCRRFVLCYLRIRQKRNALSQFTDSVSDREGKEQRGGGGCVGASFLSEEYFLFQVLRHFNLDMTDITHRLLPQVRTQVSFSLDSVD